MAALSAVTPRDEDDGREDQRDATTELLLSTFSSIVPSFKETDDFGCPAFGSSDAAAVVVAVFGLVGAVFDVDSAAVPFNVEVVFVAAVASAVAPLFPTLPAVLFEPLPAAVDAVVDPHAFLSFAVAVVDVVAFKEDDTLWSNE